MKKLPLIALTIACVTAAHTEGLRQDPVARAERQRAENLNSVCRSRPDAIGQQACRQRDAAFAAVEQHQGRCWNPRSANEIEAWPTCSSDGRNTAVATNTSASEPFYRSLVYGIGDSLGAACEAFPNGIPAGLWGNKEAVKITEVVSRTGRMLKVIGVYPSGPKSTYWFFRQETDCQAAARGEKVDQDPDGKLGSTLESTPPSRSFGMYGGQSRGIEIGIETRAQGTAMVVVNHTSTAIDVDPRTLRIVTSRSTESPCTLHMLGLMGLGSPLQAVRVAPGKKEGFMLGACVDKLSGTPLSGPVVTSGAVQRVELGRVIVPVKPMQ